MMRKREILLKKRTMSSFQAMAQRRCRENMCLLYALLEASVDKQHEQGRESREADGLRHKDRGHGSCQKEGPDAEVEVGGRQELREPLQDWGHGGDVEDEAREQKGRQKAREKSCLGSHKLALHVHRDEQSLAKGAEHEDGRDGKKSQIGSPEGHVEDQDGKNCAQDEREHAQGKVGDKLAKDELQTGDGCCQHGFHGAALPLSGKDQGGEQRAYEGHDDRDGAWHKEVHALGRRVVPKALLHRDLGRMNTALAHEAPYVPKDDALRVGLQKACGIGLCAVNHKLQGGRDFPLSVGFGKKILASRTLGKACQAALVVFPDAYKALDCGLAHGQVHFLHVVADVHPKPGRGRKVRDQGRGGLGLALVEDANAQKALVQADAVAKEKEEEGWQKKRYHVGGGVAHNLGEFLGNEGQDLLAPQLRAACCCRRVHAMLPAPVCVWRSIWAMKAFSRVGSSRCAILLHSALSSSGLPRLIMAP